MKYYFVDYENTQAIDLDKIVGLPVKVFLFIGVRQTRLPFELVAKIHKHAGQIELIPCGGTGKNALDFHIAYQMGRITTEVPGASVHITSKDTGFDPLVKYLNANGFKAERSDVFMAPSSKAATKTPAKPPVRTKAPAKTPGRAIAKPAPKTEKLSPSKTDFVSMTPPQRRDYLIKRLSTHSTHALPGKQKTLQSYIAA
ncbi:MAG: PIN domain-containing protein, partial [Chthoniobacterales bacterium]